MASYEFENFISQVEKGYFEGGPYSESIVKEDLQTRRASDIYSTVGSAGTNRLREKKEFYVKNFNEILENIEYVMDKEKADHSFLSKCVKCKNQLNKLLAVVRNF